MMDYLLEDDREEPKYIYRCENCDETENLYNYEDTILCEHCMIDYLVNVELEKNHIRKFFVEEMLPYLCMYYEIKPVESTNFYEDKRGSIKQILLDWEDENTMLSLTNSENIYTEEFLINLFESKEFFKYEMEGFTFNYSEEMLDFFEVIKIVDEEII